jgi:hypothetical protein
VNPPAARQRQLLNGQLSIPEKDGFLLSKSDRVSEFRGVINATRHAHTTNSGRSHP